VNPRTVHQPKDRATRNGASFDQRAAVAARPRPALGRRVIDAQNAPAHAIAVRVLGEQRMAKARCASATLF
jgi:hypothetical protein